MLNAVLASGELIAKQPLRYTPAGVPVIEFRLAHQSEQAEAGTQRQINCEIPCVCLGHTASALHETPTGTALKVKGFLASRSRRWPQSLVLHITDFRIESHTGPTEFSS